MATVCRKLWRLWAARYGDWVQPSMATVCSKLWQLCAARYGDGVQQIGYVSAGVVKVEIIEAIDAAENPYFDMLVKNSLNIKTDN